MAMLLVAGALLINYATMLALWFALGLASTLCQIPIETILRRMTERRDRQVVYAAYYCVSSALLLIAYLAAGWVGAQAGQVSAFISLGLMAAFMMVLAARIWPNDKVQN
jgi:MFS family permease